MRPPCRLPRCARLLFAVLMWGLAAAARATLQLDASVEVAQVWPAVTIHEEQGAALSIDEVLAAPQRFAPPPSNRATLGLGPVPVWLRIPVVAKSASDWVLDVNYPPLNRIDVYLVRDGRVVQQARLGNLVPSAERPLRSRAHALPIHLAPGVEHAVYLRVQTEGGRILPISFERPDAFHQRALAEQMLQGLLAGLGTCLLVYSLFQWLGAREPMFLSYAVLLGGSLMFSVAQFGLGEQYLWSGNAWAERHAPGLSALVAAAGTFLFVRAVLDEPGLNRWFGRLMAAGAALLLATAAAFTADLISLQFVSAVVGSLGLAPALLGLPGALRRVRRGDSIGWYFIVAWLGYFLTTAVMVSMIKGRVGVSFWTLHSFQIGATLDMLLFMRILTLRFRAIHEAARQATRERDRLHSLAHTDALTGLPNRRGLEDSLAHELAACGPQRPLALYLLDLDGFKEVNDRHGHEIGDRLLVAVARRLRASVRAGDLVARLGGDEFVVMVGALARDAEAGLVGQQLLAALEAPFQLDELSCRVGMTVGYVLAPADGTNAADLMRRADAALFAGKRNGKGRVQRATAAVPEHATPA
ncbi:MAG TPA: diguanylate cyclase [Methylibium sp.]|nr:diguanylate cyclase [Methylibium sp.]